MSITRLLQYALIIVLSIAATVANAAVINVSQDVFSVSSRIGFLNDPNPDRVQTYSGLGLFAGDTAINHFEAFGADESHLNRAVMRREFDGVYYGVSGESGLGSSVDTAIDSQWDFDFSVDGIGATLSLFMGQANLTPGGNNTAWGNFTLLDLTDNSVVASRNNSDFAFVNLTDGHAYSLSVDLSVRGNYDLPAFLAADFFGTGLSLNYVDAPEGFYLLLIGVVFLLLVSRSSIRRYQQ